MKKIYSLWLTALLMFVASFQASAALTTTIRWNVAGAISIYVGGSADRYKVTVPADATEYVATIDNTWGSTYIAPATGYSINSVSCEGTVIRPMYNGNYNINMETYNGKVVEVDVEKIVYDATFSINVINGRDALTATMWGTNREITFQTGLQEIAYSSKFEQGIDIQAPVAGAVDPVLTQDGIEMEWKAYYNWDSTLYHKDAASGNKGFPFSAGTTFTVKYCDTADEEEVVIEKPVVTIDYADDMARNSVVMIFNITQMKTISERESFEVNEGDEVRIVFDTKEYDVSLSGTSYVTNDLDGTTSYVFTVDGDLTLSVSATERVYGTTFVTLNIADIDGVVLREGAYNGPEIDASALTSIGTVSYRYETYNKVSKTATLNTYSVNVSLKSPKIYVSEKDGYWFEACEYKDGSDVVPSTVATVEAPLFVVDREFDYSTNLVVYLATDGVNVTPESVVLRDRNRNEFKLENGYNELKVDVDYSSPFSVLCYENNGSFSVYNDMAGVSQDEESGAYNCDITSDAVLHIFAGRPAATEYTISAYLTPDVVAPAEVVVDRIHKLSAANPTCFTFKNCEISVTPGANPYLLDGVAPEYEGETHTFKASADHSIILGDVAKMTITPSNDAEIEEFTNIVISFPNATNVTIDEELVGDMLLCDVTMMHYGTTSLEITQVAGAKAPTFRVAPSESYLPTYPGGYRFVVPAGLFVIEGSILNEETVATFSILNTLTTDEIVVNFDPMDDEITDLEYFYGVTVIFGEEYGDFSLEPTEAAEGIKVTFGDTEWVIGEDYDIMMEENIIAIMPMVAIDITETTVLSVYFPEGAFSVSGVASPEVNHSWTLVVEAENVDVNGDGDLNVADITALIDVLLNSEEYVASADVNNDGTVDVKDVTAIVDLLLQADAEPETNVEE